MPIVEIPTSYIYVDQENWAGRYLKATSELGWTRRSLLTQFVRDYCSQNIEFYQNAAVIDSESRGYSSPKGQYYVDLKNSHDTSLSQPQLRPYQTGTIRPSFPKSPLTDLEFPAIRKNRRTFKSIRTSGRDAAILSLILGMEALNMVQVLSKIAYWHFENHWGNGNYCQAIASDEQQTLAPDMSKWPEAE